jgi:Single-strand binding protein family
MPRTKQPSTVATPAGSETRSQADPATPAEAKAGTATRQRRAVAGATGTGRDGEPGSGTVPADEPVDVNLVVLGGRLAADAEFRSYDSGSSAMRFLVTVRLTEPRRRIDVIPVILWGPGRRLVRKPPVRGDRVWFTGNVHRRFWEGPDGRRSRVEVVAHRLDLGDALPPELRASR